MNQSSWIFILCSFRKHVKPKKQYELARMGKFIKDTMSEVKEFLYDNCIVYIDVHTFIECYYYKT